MLSNYKFYAFGLGKAEEASVEILGGKGAGLVEMSKMGLPVPPGFVIPTTACVEYLNDIDVEREVLLNSLTGLAIAGFQNMKSTMKRPILVSVRSGARVSMPGMMDTILNVGLTSNSSDEMVELLGAECVMNCNDRLHDMWQKTVGTPLPDTLEGQLRGAIKAVFDSWNSERAVEYRKVNNIPGEWGTAVVIQVMVYGNLNDKSCSGVVFSRDPSTGEPKVTGEFLPNAQGEDVVAGTHTPRCLQTELPAWNPAVSTQLINNLFELETHYTDMQDVEFTVEDGKLYLLQTRSAKRSAAAAFKVAHDMAEEGVITKAEAVKRVTGKQYLALRKPVIDPKFSVAPTGTGVAASPGLVSGVAVLSSADAKASKAPCILVAEETTPDDFPGMVASAGLLTYKGGMTSHAAVVARGMDRACVVGLLDLHGKINAGDKVTIDGITGRVWVNVDVPIIVGKLTEEARTVLKWAVAASDVFLLVKVEERGKPSEEEWLKRLQDTLPDTGRIILDVSGVEARYGYQYLLKILMWVLKGPKKDLHGVISFTPVKVSGVAAEDVEFLRLLGVMAGASAAVSGGAGAKVWLTHFEKCMGTAHKSIKDRWSVLPAAFASGTDIVDSIRGLGWRVVTPVSTLEDMLGVDGYFSLTTSGIKAISEKSKEGLLKLMKEAGRKVAEMPEAVDSDSVAFSVLGK